MRLIDADVLVEIVGQIKVTDDIYSSVGEIYETIKNAPTAYNVENVIRQMEKNCHVKYEQEFGYCFDGEKYLYLSDAINMVKAGYISE